MQKTRIAKLYYGPYWDIERYGKRTAVHAAAESWHCIHGEKCSGAAAFP
jgi:hypothetical protein